MEKKLLIRVPPKVLLKDLAPTVGVEVHHYYSWNIFVRRLFDKRLATAVTLAGSEAFLRVLDLGCGASFLSYNLAQHGAETHALDLYVDLKGVKSVMDKLVLNRIRFIKGDGENLPFRSSSFDVVFALDVLEHMPNLHEAINEIHRILKCGGILVVSVPYEGNFLYSIGSALAVEPGIKHTVVSLKQKREAPHVNILSDVMSKLKEHFFLDRKSEIPLFPKLFFVASYRKP